METRPFNLEHAKAGAPVMLENGTEGRIIAFNRASADSKPIVFLTANGDIAFFKENGVPLPGRAQLAMAPVNALEGKPVFFGNTIERLCRGGWETWIVDAAIWLPEARFRWPRPKRMIPPSAMNDAELREVWSLRPAGANDIAAMRAIANVAINRAVGDGDLILKNEVDHMAAADAMRDEILFLLGEERSNWAVQKEVFTALDALKASICRVDAGKFNKP